MKTIAIYNAKGGVGSTVLATAFCIILARAGVRVVGASLDSCRELRQFLTRRGIPWFDALAELPEGEEVLVLDVRSTTRIVDVLRPTLWVVPMDNRTAYENAINVMPQLAGPALWVWSNVGLPADEAHEITNPRPVPEALRERVAFADQIILRDPALAVAADYLELACPACSESMRQIEALVRSTAARIGLQLDEDSYQPWRGMKLATVEQEHAYMHKYREREEKAREHLRAFFETR
jgi:hypothetical protein